MRGIVVDVGRRLIALVAYSGESESLSETPCARATREYIPRGHRPDVVPIAVRGRGPDRRV
jgi:hypothetical protein